MNNLMLKPVTQITQAIPLKIGYSRKKLMFWKGYKCCKSLKQAAQIPPI